MAAPDDDFGRFFLPGPTEVHPDVLRSMVRPMLPHRGPEMAALVESVEPGLRRLFGTGRPVYFAASSATGMMEAGVRALPRDRILSLVNGAFSERYARIAETCGHEVERMPVAWGEVHDPDAVARRVRGARRFAGVTVVHSETSTGALQDLGALSEAIGDNAFLLVDTVTGLGGTPVEFDRFGLAYACSGSQKALALPPGLALAVASSRLLERAAGAAGRGTYLDLLAFEERTPPFTPALPQLYALQRQLERIEAEGLEARYARHRAMAERTRAWVEQTGKGLAILAAEGARSPTVTCVRLPASLPGPEFVRRVRERGYVIGGGYGRLEPDTFRIGHMGDQTLETLGGVLTACREALG